MLSKENRYKLALADAPDSSLELLLGEIPARWGRMSVLSRLVLLETANVLQAENLLEAGQKASDIDMSIGLIGASKRGSLQTDLSYIETMKSEGGLVSPALFGYTLPNIPLAEAAVAFGLTGPVYAIFNNESPLETAEKEARSFLELESDLDCMLACEFDQYENDGQQYQYINITVVRL